MLYDYIIIGGGIVGVATAYELLQRLPSKKILLIEKEDDFAEHQTGHNSGVIHAGVYYAPGSLKAKFCKQGAKATIDFCKANNISFEQCGKLLVATSEQESVRMADLYKRCLENEIEVQMLDSSALKELEPHINGVGALLVRDTAIVDYRQITKTMVEKIKTMGGEVLLGQKVVALKENTASIEVVAVDKKEHVKYDSRFLIACSGLMADRTAKMLGIPINFQIIPYRGEYYRLSPQFNTLVSHLIYPIPDPALPFLGVHLTRMIDGTVTVGPNAVQGWKREGYGRGVNLSWTDMVDMVCFKGFWKVAKNNLATGLIEMKNSIWKPGYLKLVQKYCPELRLADLLPYPAGIRAQAVLDDGSLVHDFLFAESRRSLHVCNAPSPAATSAIPIGGYICNRGIDKVDSL